MNQLWSELICAQLQQRNDIEHRYAKKFIADYQQLYTKYCCDRSKQSESTSPSTFSPTTVSATTSSSNSSDRQKLIELQSQMLVLTRDKAQIMDSMLSLTDHLAVLERELEEERSARQQLLEENQLLKQEAQRYKSEGDYFIVEIQRRDKEIHETDLLITDMKRQISELTLKNKSSTYSATNGTDTPQQQRIRELESFIEEKTFNHQIQLQHVVSSLQNECSKVENLERQLRKLKQCIRRGKTSSDLDTPISESHLWGISVDQINCANQAIRNSRDVSKDIRRSLSLMKSINFKSHKSFAAHSCSINSVAFNSAGSLLATGADDKTIKLWDTNDFSCVKTLSGATDAIMHVQFSKNGDLLLGTSLDSIVRLWDVEKGMLKASLSGHTSKVFGGCFVSPQQLVTGSHDKTIKVWDVTALKSIRTFLAISSCNDVETISESTCVSCHFDAALRFWDTRKHASCAIIQSQHQQQITSVSISKDGNYVLTNSKDHSLKIFDVRKNSELVTLTHQNYVCGPSYSKASLSSFSDHHQIVAISNHRRRATYIWNLDSQYTELNVQQLEPQDKKTIGSSDVSTCAVFSADGHTIASNIGSNLQIFRIE